MSVLKSKRKESKFEVFDYFYRTRKEITDLLLRDFGYDKTKSDARVQKYFGGRTYAELNDSEKERYIKIQNKNIAFDDWYSNQSKMMSRQQKEQINKLYKTLREDIACIKSH